MRKTRLFLAWLLIFVSFAANADTIHGEVQFAGLAEATGGTDGLGDATAIDFMFAFVTYGDGAYAGAAGTLATFTNFTFDPFAAAVTPLWTFTVGTSTFSFDLESVSIVQQNSSFLSLSGSGTLMATGYYDTPGSWTFTGTGDSSIFTFASSTVPEPGTLALLGLGLAGMGLARRRRKI